MPLGWQETREPGAAARVKTNLTESRTLFLNPVVGRVDRCPVVAWHRWTNSHYKTSRIWFLWLQGTVPGDDCDRGYNQPQVICVNEMWGRGQWGVYVGMCQFSRLSCRRGLLLSSHCGFMWQCSLGREDRNNYSPWAWVLHAFCFIFFLSFPYLCQIVKEISPALFFSYLLKFFWGDNSLMSFAELHLHSTGKERK